MNRSHPIIALVWLVLLFSLAALWVLAFSAGCSTTYLRDGEFTGVQMRFGWDTKLGRLDLVRSPTTQSMTVENLASNPNADIARALAEGATSGALKAVKP